MSYSPASPRPTARHGQLLAAALTALARGSQRPAGARRNAEAEIEAIYSARIARDLTGEEARDLAAIAAKRELALATCRAGRVTDAVATIVQARRMLSETVMGREAFVLSDSFLCAGEAFVHYRSGLAGEAISHLLAAIERCRELRDAYGFPVEGRRIHLACNILRVQAEAATKESSALATQLIKLIGTSRRVYWPYPDLEYASEPDTLDDDVRAELMDQCLAVIPRLAPQSLTRVAAGLAYPASGGSQAAIGAQSFVAAIAAYAAGDTETFLQRCIDFFPSAAHQLPRACKHLGDRLSAIAAVSGRRMEAGGGAA